MPLLIHIYETGRKTGRGLDNIIIYELPPKKDGFNPETLTPHPPPPCPVVHKQGQAGRKQTLPPGPSSSPIPLCRLSLCSSNHENIIYRKTIQIMPSYCSLEFFKCHFYYEESLEDAGITQTGLNWDNEVQD